MVAARMTPVRPMPPAVASNRSRAGGDGADLAVRGEQFQGPHVAGEGAGRRGGSCRGCRRRSPRRPSRSGCRASPARTSPAAAAPASGGAGSRPASHVTTPAVGVDARGSGPARSCRDGAPAFCAASPYARPSPRAMPPRGPHSRTAVTASAAEPGRTRRAEVGAVRPQPVTDDGVVPGRGAGGTGGEGAEVTSGGMPPVGRDQAISRYCPACARSSPKRVINGVSG